MTSELPALLRAAAARIEELEGEHAKRRTALAARARELCDDPEVWEMRNYARHVRARHGVMRQLRAEGNGFVETWSNNRSA